MPKDSPHSMCVSLRLDPATLKALKEESLGTTLSVVLGSSINQTLRKLAVEAKEVE